MNNSDLVNSIKFGLAQRKWIPEFLPIIAIITYAVYLCQAIYVDRALYADGANFFVEILSKDSIWPTADDSKHIRLFVNILNQFPVVLALDVGVTSLRVLRILFGLGLFLIPISLYLYCFYLSRRAHDYRVLFFSIACLVTCAIPSDIFIINQAFTSLALAWVMVHYLLLDLKIKWFDWVIVLALSLLLFRSHESLVLWGVIFFLGSICVIFFQRRRNFYNKSLIIYLIGMMGILQAAFVVFWLASHPLEEQSSGYLKLIHLLSPGELWVGNTRISLLIIIALLLIFIGQNRLNFVTSISKIIKVLSKIGLFFVLLLMLVSGISALWDFTLTNPSREYAYRFLITFGAAGWMIGAIVLMLSNKYLSNRTSLLIRVVLSVGVISASLWQISNNIQWSIFAKTTSQVLRSATVLIVDPIEVHKKMVLFEQQNTFKYSSGWTWPVLGMSLQDSGVVERLFSTDGWDIYFNPPARIPFIPMSGGDVGNEGVGLFDFDRFVKLQESPK